MSAVVESRTMGNTTPPSSANGSPASSSSGSSDRSGQARHHRSAIEQACTERRDLVASAHTGFLCSVRCRRCSERAPRCRARSLRIAAACTRRAIACKQNRSSRWRPDKQRSWRCNSMRLTRSSFPRPPSTDIPRIAARADSRSDFSQIRLAPSLARISWRQLQACASIRVL